MSTPINWVVWAKIRKQIEACLREGYAPQGAGGGKGSAVQEAERRLRASGIIAQSRCLSAWVPIQERRAAQGLDNCLPDWTIYQKPGALRTAATSRVVERAILTSAQNDTDVHRPFFANLRALALYYGARIHVGRFSYKTLSQGDRLRDTKKLKSDDMVWRPELADFLTSERFGVGSVLFCAEMNTLPTAARPLSGLHTYGQGKTAIFPHAKVSLETVPHGGDGNPPIVLSTGCCTVPNYTDTKAGHKGVFHHVLGTVIVEVDEAGRTFFRHVIATHDGSFQDLDIIVKDGKVTTGHRAEAITFGDCHVPFLDPAVARATWGIDLEAGGLADQAGSMVDLLRPRFGFFHDLIDFKSINHHEERAPRKRFRDFLAGGHRVESDIGHGAKFLDLSSRDFMKSIVIESNHGRWLERWLDRADHRQDRDNARIFLKLERARFEAEAAGDSEFNVLGYALHEASAKNEFSFVPDGGSFKICQDAGAIECGAHGHLGVNGAHGTPTGLTKVGEKMSIGDKHAPGIYDGLYVAGVSCKLRLGYNIGPSGWAHAHILAYGSGKRTLIFIQDGKWRA